MKFKLEKTTYYWLIWIICLSIIHYNRFYPRITHPSLLVNDILFGLLLLVTPILIIISKKISNKIQRKFCLSISIIINILLGLRFILFILGVYLEDYNSTKHHDFRLDSSLEYKQSQIKIYEVDCGATCSVAILIRKETPIFLNFQITKELYFEDKCWPKDIKLNLKSDLLELTTCKDEKKSISLIH